jgi:PAS domain S-box-containing protein
VLRPNPKWLRAFCMSDDPVYIVNDAQRIVCWNAGAQKLLGYSETEVLNRPCYQIIGGKVCGKSWCHAGCTVQRSVKRGVLTQSIEMQARTRSGYEVWLNTSVFTFERKNRRFSIHLLRDMTPEELNREALEGFLDTLHSYGVADGNGSSTHDSNYQVHGLPSQVLSVAHLTSWEIQVLQLLGEGVSTRALAKRLGVSPFTVRRHIETILLKTGLHTQAQAVAYAYRVGLL